jgi:hypothetical protein
MQIKEGLRMKEVPCDKCGYGLCNYQNCETLNDFKEDLRVENDKDNTSYSEELKVALK